MEANIEVLTLDTEITIINVINKNELIKPNLLLLK
jgi:hypothetical protein